MSQVPRRQFLAAAGALVAAPLQALAQTPTTTMPRIGFLGVANPAAWAPRVDAFRAGLRDLGYVEGKNILIEFRFAEGQYDRLPVLAAELVRLKVDVIVTHSGPGALAAKQATATNPIPVVMTNVGDAVGSGHRREPRPAWREHHRRHVLRHRARGETARSCSRMPSRACAASLSS